METLDDGLYSALEVLQRDNAQLLVQRAEDRIHLLQKEHELQILKEKKEMEFLSTQMKQINSSVIPPTQNETILTTVDGPNNNQFSELTNNVQQPYKEEPQQHQLNQEAPIVKPHDDEIVKENVRDQDNQAYQNRSPIKSVENSDHEPNPRTSSSFLRNESPSSQVVLH